MCQSYQPSRYENLCEAMVSTDLLLAFCVGLILSGLNEGADYSQESSWLLDFDYIVLWVKDGVAEFMSAYRLDRLLEDKPWIILAFTLSPMIVNGLVVLFDFRVRRELWW